MQSVPFTLGGNIFMAIFTKCGLHALEWCVALAAAVANVGMGHDIGNGRAAVVKRRQFARAKSATPSEVNANRQSYPQNKSRDKCDGRKDGMLAFQPPVLPHLNKPARK